MMPAAKHFDPVLGVDIHIIQPPGPVPPVPLPHPFIGFLFDPFDYAPVIGATVIINGVPRAIAGTMGRTIPGVHFPIGGTFIKPPANECEMFMGSTTVDFDGDAASYMALPALSCQCIGMVAPFRRKKKGKIKSLVLPFSLVLPIPIGMPVVIGGPPTISLMAMAMRLGMGALGKGLKKLSKTKPFRKLKSKFKRKKPSTNKACGRSGEPVDVATGANVDSFIDYELPAPIPILWKRYYDSSQARFDGPLGFGFRHEYQRVLRRQDDIFEYITQEGEIVEFPAPTEGAPVFNDGFVLHRTGAGQYRIDHVAQPSMHFVMRDDEPIARLLSLTQDEHWVHFDYERSGCLAGLRDSSGHYLAVTNDVAGRISSLQLREGSAWTTIAQYGYDNAGNLVAWRDALGHTANYSFDVQARMVRKSDRRGYSFHYEYDARGRCTHAFGDDGLYDVRLEYLSVERCTIVTWADGARYEYFYDEDGILTRIVDPYGGERVFVTDEDGRVVEDIHPSGSVTRLIYNEAGAHTHRVDALGYASLPVDIEPHRPNPLEHRMAANPLQWEFGWLQQRLSPLPTGSTVDESHPAEVRDGMGRLTERKDAMGRRERFAHDPSGNVIGRQDKDGGIWKNEIGSWNLLVGKVNPLGERESFDYSLRGIIKRIVDGAGNASEYSYDWKDRLVEIRRHGVVREGYEYDSGDNLIRKLNGDGETLLEFKVNPLGLILERQLRSGEVHKFEYNASGHCTRAACGDTRISLDWIGKNCIQDLRNEQGVEAEFIGSLLRSMTVLDRYRSKYIRTVTELVIEDPAAGRHRFSIPASGVVKKQLSNGFVEISTYDAAGRCTEKNLTSAHHSEWIRRYTLSGEGHLRRTEDSRSGVTTYQYDKAHRLTSVSYDGRTLHFRYDSAGNLVGQPGLDFVSMDSGNRLQNANGDPIGYDKRNHLSKHGETEFEYDACDYLVSISSPSGRWAAAYDGLGRRVTSTFGALRREFYWYGDRLAAEVLPSGRFRVYVYVDEWALVPFLLVDYENPQADPDSGQRYFVYTNQIGAPIEVQDDNGVVVWSAVIDPYGKANIAPESRIELNLRWPGHYFDPETGLHYNRFRYYSPELGRYLQSDPAGQSGGLNLYAYPASPLSVVDLRGLHPDADDGKKAANNTGGPNAENPARSADTDLPDISDRFTVRPRWRQGRFEYEEISGRLGVPGKVKTHRSASAQRAMSRGTGDHAGHRIGVQFGAPGDGRNMSLQNANTNTRAPRNLHDTFRGPGGSYLDLENQWAQKLQQGWDIDVVVRDRYRPGQDRPISRFVEWTEVDPNGRQATLSLEFLNTTSPQSRARSGQ